MRKHSVLSAFFVAVTTSFSCQSSVFAQTSPRSTQQAAWDLGDTLNLAAVGHGEDIAPATVNLDADGVETRSGQKYQWGRLYYLDYKNVNLARGNLAVAATQAAMFAGAQQVTVELIFEAGKAVIPPLTANQPQLLGLLETMPVQRREDGQVRQN